MSAVGPKPTKFEDHRSQRVNEESASLYFCRSHTKKGRGRGRKNWKSGTDNWWMSSELVARLRFGNGQNVVKKINRGAVRHLDAPLTKSVTPSDVAVASAGLCRQQMKCGLWKLTPLSFAPNTYQYRFITCNDNPVHHQGAYSTRSNHGN